MNISFPAPKLGNPLVIVESPFAHAVHEIKGLYRDYLREAARDCFLREEVPFASHALFTQWLDDDDAHERQVGIAGGLVFAAGYAQRSVVYHDLGISTGMTTGIESAETCAPPRPVEYRKLGGRWSAAGQYIEGYMHGLSGAMLPEVTSGWFQFGWGAAKTGKRPDFSFMEGMWLQ